MRTIFKTSQFVMHTSYAVCVAVCLTTGLPLRPRIGLPLGHHARRSCASANPNARYTDVCRCVDESANVSHEPLVCKHVASCLQTWCKMLCLQTNLHRLQTCFFVGFRVCKRLTSADSSSSFADAATLPAMRGYRGAASQQVSTRIP